MDAFTWENFGEFKELLREEMRHTKRTLATALDTHAFYICRGACRNTPRVDGSKIRAELGADAKSSKDSTVAQAIIASRMRKSGKKLTAQEFKDAVNKMIAARVRSRAYLAAGWLPAIKILEQTADAKSWAPRIDNGLKRRFPKPKGTARPADPSSLAPSVTFINSASTRHDKKNALARYASSAFTQAFADESAKIAAYIEKKKNEYWSKMKS